MKFQFTYMQNISLCVYKTYIGIYSLVDCLVNQTNIHIFKIGIFVRKVKLTNVSK